MPAIMSSVHMLTPKSRHGETVTVWFAIETEYKVKLAWAVVAVFSTELSRYTGGGS